MIESLSSGFTQLIALINNIDPLYIYFILYGMAFMENIVPPIPGDTFTIIGGYLAAAGTLDLAPTFLCITAGTLSSIMVVYWVGYRGGREFIQRKNYRIFSAMDLERVDGWFEKYGAGILIASRFVVGGRVAIALGAGLSKYPTVRMAVYSYISSVLFHGALIALAYLMHSYIDRLVEGFNVYSKIILAILGVLVILWIILIIRRIRHGQSKV